MNTFFDKRSSICIYIVRKAFGLTDEVFILRAECDMRSLKEFYIVFGPDSI